MDFSSAVKLVPLIAVFLAANAVLIALMAASLVAEVVGTLTLLMLSTPVFLAVFTASLVVALLMLAIASSASCCAWPTNVDFSSAVKLVPLIAVFLAANAVLIALMAASLVAEVVGTLMLLIFSTPVFLADSTSPTVDALLMAVLALSASFLACSFTACFSSEVRLGAPSIELFFSASAPSIAAFALTLSIATVPLLTASVTALLDLA